MEHFKLLKIYLTTGSLGLHSDTLCEVVLGDYIAN